MTIHSRRPLLLLIGVGLLMLSMAFALGACGVGFNLSCGSASSGIKTYTDADYGYSFGYPAGWKLQPKGTAQVAAGASAKGSVGAYNPDGANANGNYYDLAEVSVYQLTVTIDSSMMPDIKTEIEKTFAGLESQAGDWKALDTLTDVTVGGLNGWKVNYSFTEDGKPALCTFYVVFGGDLEYQLLVQAVSENWQEDQPAFNAFVASFKPGSPTETTATTSQ